MKMIQVCRLCGIKSSDNWINIFTKDRDNVQLIVKIKSYIPILIYRTDPLSKFICSKCCLKVDEFYNFLSSVVANNNANINELRECRVTNENVQLYLNSLNSFKHWVNKAQNKNCDDLDVSSDGNEQIDSTAGATPTNSERIDSVNWQDYADNVVIRNKWLAAAEEEQQQQQMDENEGDEYEEPPPDDEHEVDDQQDEDQVEIKTEQVSEDEEYEKVPTELLYPGINGVGDLLIEKPQSQIQDDMTTMEPLDAEEGKVGNTPFHHLEKKERFQYYKIVHESGLKRRQCPFCLRSFKDGWSVDDHVLKNRCRLVCPFCHKYFQKDDHDVFYRHLDHHRTEPDYYNLTQRWRKNILRAQQIYRSQEIARFYQQQPPRPPPQQQQQQQHHPPIKTEHINPTQLLELQYNPQTQHVSDSSGVVRSVKPYRSFYCRNCYKVFYQEHDLNLHTSRCPEASIAPGIDFDNGSATPMKKQIFRCGFCPAVFYNSNARNSHMRVHKEKMISNNKMSTTPPAGFMAMLQQRGSSITPVSSSTGRVIDENLARLAQNPHITIKPSNVKRTDTPQPAATSQPLPPPPPPPPEKIYQLKPKPLPSTTAPPGTPELRTYQCNPCGQTCLGQKMLYEHKKTCPAALLKGSDNKTSTTSSTRKYRCSACNRRFVSKSSLSTHRQTYCTRYYTRVFDCPYCKKKFNTESQYTNHILYNHPE